MKADIKWLDNPEIYCVNRLDAHSDHMYFESYEEIGKSSNKWEVLLDGLWKFHYSKNAASRPADFYREDYDRSDFDTIKVPGHIELQGYDKFIILIQCIHGRDMNITGLHLVFRMQERRGGIQ